MATFNQNNFLEQFDQPIKKYIIEYCKKISEKKYDVYIMLARKAACFLTTLEELGLISFNGIVVSDRILEYNTKWLEGKSVAIIDDTIISGTSICKIINRLKSINVASINVHAFCINEYWYSEDMLKDGDVEYLTPPYMRVNHTSSIRFCKQIVDALSIVPRPYNIDFPVYEIGKLSRRSYSILIEDDNWKTVNTATLLQEEYSVGCASFNFKRKLLKQFNDSLGCDLTKVLFVKLRLFTKELFDNINVTQSRYLCKVVPYVIFNPIKIELAINIVKSICSCENISSEKLLNELKTNSAKLLFIQYYFAARLVKWWIDYVEKLLQKTIVLNENKRSLFLLFSPTIVDLIKGFSFNNKIIIPSNVLNNAVLCNEYQLANVSTPVNPLFIKAKLTGLFLNLYYEKELFARKTVKSIGKKAFEDVSYNKIINRLDDGISIDKLKKEVSSYVDNSTDRNLILSTFLDNAIDKGIIVPITSFNEGFVYRGFRHGEEVIWGDANDKLMAIFFKNLYGNNIIPKLLFEKLLVLFLKIGLKQKFLSEYDQTTPPSQKMRLMGIRSYIHGQVCVYNEIEANELVEYDQILKTNSNAYWTTRRLCDLRLLSLIKSKGDESEYKLNFDRLLNKREIDPLTKKDLDLDPGDVDKVNNLADIIKICLERKWIKSSVDLVILTSCMSLHDNTSSIGAELQVYSDCIKSYCNEIIGVIRDGVFTESSIVSLKNANLFKAVNSGFMKYHRFRNKDGINLVNNIKERLALVNVFAARQWDEYWRKDIELLQTQDPELLALNNKMGFVIIDITVSLDCLFLLLLEIIQRNILAPCINENMQITKNIDLSTKSLKQRIELKRKSTSSIKNKIDVLTEEKALSLLCSDFCRDFLYEKFKDYDKQTLYKSVDKILETLDRLKNISDECLLEFNSLVPKWGKIRNPKRYLSFMHLNTKSSNYDCRDKIGKVIKAELAAFELEEYNEMKDDKSIVILRNDDIKIGGKGYVLGAKGVRHDEKLIRFGCRILRHCKELKEQIVITYCPDFFENGIKAWYNPQTKLYDSIKEDLYQLMPDNQDEDCISVFINNKYSYDTIYKTLKKYNLQQTFELCQTVSNNNLKFKIQMNPTKKVFISFSRKDVDYKDELKKHLSVLNQFEIVDAWSCEEINPGKWDEQIKEHLENSDLVIYMLSANFFSSKYVLEQEVQNIISNGSKKNILCILVSDICNQDKLSDYVLNSLSEVNDKQKAALVLRDFQYFPYGKVWNPVAEQNEEKIIPLKDYRSKTGSSIEVAFSQIINKIVDSFRNSK